MSGWSVNMVSAFGRGETLALALHENGFQVRVFDFTAAFPQEYQRGSGPFPILDKAFAPVQREFLNEIELQPQGLTFWLKDGPMELTGPFAPVHIHSHPEIQVWKTEATGGDFSRQWLVKFLEQWAAPFFSESWSVFYDSSFPAEQPLGTVPADRQASIFSFERLRVKGIDVVPCTFVRDLQVQSGRITEVEFEAGSAMAVQAPQWIWCLSTHETSTFGESAAVKLFGKNISSPDWAWVSFKGTMHKGPWTAGLPQSFIVIGDVYLPWCYGNMAVIQRSDDLRFRCWLKVPRAGMHEIDARRQWSKDLEAILWQRLPMAEWKIDSADWSVCPHSEVYASTHQGARFTQWRNLHLIAPQSMERLDMSARLEREAMTFRKLLQWRNETAKKEGARSDHALHTP